MSILHGITKSLSKRMLSRGIWNGAKQNYLFIFDQSYREVSKLSIPLRYIWGYVAIAFNQVDKERLARVGPNRLCAEWILKNGGGVRFTENPTKLWKDYNQLPSESTSFRIKVVDATNASIMKIGLDHFKGCHNIDTVIFHNCKHLENDSLEGLTHLKDSLTALQVSGCYNISDSGLAVISALPNLRQLIIFDMIYVKDMDKVTRYIKENVPECDIQVTKSDSHFKK